MIKILEVKNLEYGGFHDFNLAIAKDKHISIIGTNMCGKTTLFKIITGIIPTYNCVKCNDIWLNREHVNKYITQIGVAIPYKEGVFLFDNVYDELSYPLKNLGYSDFYINSSINNVLKLFNLDIKTKKMEELTLFEKQCLLFALALIHKPKVLIINEVYDYLLKDDVIKILDILKGLSITIINFSTILDYVNYDDYVYILDNHQIVYQKEAAKILNESDLLARIGLKIPFMRNLSNKFKEIGLIDKNYDNLEDMVNVIWK